MNRRQFAIAMAGAPAIVRAAGRDDTWKDVPHWMEVACVPGAVVAVIEKGSVAAIHPFGVRRAEQSDPIGPNTVFEAASLSKPVFATAVLRLVEKKELDLARPLAEIVPLADHPRAKLITARHVLSHSSGLQNWRNRDTDQLQFAFPPGERFSYSGEGYFHLQRVVEKVTGKPFARYMQETVLEPLGMSRSNYVRKDEPDSATPHGSRGKPIEPFSITTGKKLSEIAREWKKPVEDWTYEDVERAMPLVKLPVLPNYMLPNAAASLVTTATDYSKFLLHSFSIDVMRQPQVKINSDLSWGLGCGLEGSGAGQMFWHWGDNGGFKNIFIADAKARSGILVFTNGDGGAKLYQRIVRSAVGRDFSAFLWI